MTVDYTGWLANGKQFDTSRGRKPWRFVWGRNQVIRGYEEGLASCAVGCRRKMIIPPALAYGANGFKKLIPPDATLTFDVQIRSIR